MERPRILVCGGRDFSDYDRLRSELYYQCDGRGWNYPLDDFGNTLPNVVIIHGGAKGADELADEWAIVNWTGLEVYEANWDKYKNAAGPIRNQQMLDEGKPDLVIAFPTKKSKGTYDMIRRAEKAGIEVVVIGP